MRKRKKRKQRNPKVIIACLLLMLAFITEMFFYAWCRVQYTKIKYEIAEQTDRLKKLSAMQDHLKIELRRLKSPQRIGKIAREQLGMVTPSPKQTIIIPDGK
jgi:cell division protein FtsL